MKYTSLGKTDLSVSRICMGCMGFGDAGRGRHSWTLDEAHSREIIRHGLENGINFGSSRFLRENSEKGLQKEHRRLLIVAATQTRRKSSYAPRRRYRN